MSDEEVYRLLVREGIERNVAAQLVEFLPIIYSRLILRSTGAQFSNTFRRRKTDGTYEELPFASNQVFNAAVAFANDEAAHGVSGKDLLAIAARSAEFDAANQLLKTGSKLANAAFGPSVLTWTEDGPEL